MIEITEIKGYNVLTYAVDIASGMGSTKKQALENYICNANRVLAKAENEILTLKKNIDDAKTLLENINN